MIITDSSKISDIQAAFNAKFPYLKIEFYERHHDAHQGSPTAQKIDPQHSIGTIREIHNSGDLSISEDHTVSELESNFYDYYGLNIQVFRRSGNLWLQTTSTDDWTLQAQNERGKTSLQNTANETDKNQNQ